MRAVQRRSPRPTLLLTFGVLQCLHEALDPSESLQEFGDSKVEHGLKRRTPREQAGCLKFESRAIRDSEPGGCEGRVSRYRPARPGARRAWLRHGSSYPEHNYETMYP